jgi:hypothetical protein
MAGTSVVMTMVAFATVRAMLLVFTVIVAGFDP